MLHKQDKGFTQNLYMKTTIKDSLDSKMDEFSEKYGQPKTVVVERAVRAYMDSYEEMMKRAEEKA